MNLLCLTRYFQQAKNTFHCTLEVHNAYVNGKITLSQKGFMICNKFKLSLTCGFWIYVGYFAIEV